MNFLYGLVVVCAIALAQTSVVEGRFARKGDPTFVDDNLNIDFEDSNEMVFTAYKKLACIVDVIDGNVNANVKTGTKLAYGWESASFVIRNYLASAPKKSHDYQVYRLQSSKSELDEYAEIVNHSNSNLYEQIKMQIQSNC